MAASSSRTRSSGLVLPLANGFQRSISPSRRFCSSSSSTVFASASSGLSSRSTGFFHRSASPTSVNTYASLPAATTQLVRFSLDRSISPGRSIAVSPCDQVVQKQNNPLSTTSSPRRTCMCSPTNHPGSFRCSLHKGFDTQHPRAGSFPSSNRLNARRSAMTNSLVRIGTVEGELVKRALAALIRPSSHQQKRRTSFQPRPSRLSIMSKAEDL